MRVKTSITLSPETLKALDRMGGGKQNRSRLIEQAVRAYVAARARAERDARDRSILDGEADALNREMEDVLAYQERF